MKKWAMGLLVVGLMFAGISVWTVQGEQTADPNYGIIWGD